jgi:hypothetical protein
VLGAFFTEAESSWGYLRLFSEIFKGHGLPQSIYSDRHSVFWTDREPTIDEQLINKRPLTEVGRALDELGSRCACRIRRLPTVFLQTRKIAAFDSKTTHAFGLYRTNNKREGFRYGPISNQFTEYQQLSP